MKSNRDGIGRKESIVDVLKATRPDVDLVLEPGSVPDLFHSEDSVKHAAEKRLEEKLCRISLHLLILRFSMWDTEGTELPDDITNLIGLKNVENDPSGVYR